jgi:hypothetical protein
MRDSCEIQLAAGGGSPACHPVPFCCFKPFRSRVTAGGRTHRDSTGRHYGRPGRPTGLRNMLQTAPFTPGAGLQPVQGGLACEIRARLTTLGAGRLKPCAGAPVRRAGYALRRGTADGKWSPSPSSHSVLREAGAGTGVSAPESVSLILREPAMPNLSNSAPISTLASFELIAAAPSTLKPTTRVEPP